MTGNEYYKLSPYEEGTNNKYSVIKALSRSCDCKDYEKGDTFYVEYRSRFDEVVYCKSTKDKTKILILDPYYLMKDFELYNEDNKNMKTITIPFDKGDKVWFIDHDEVQQGTVLTVDIALNYVGTIITYELSYTDRNKCNQRCNKKLRNVFASKEALLKTL